MYQTNTNNYKFSIIVATYNRANLLQRCINSVIEQTYPYKELIIIDGGSTDNTVEILKANNDKIAYWKSEPDRGIYHAFNKGLEHVRGNWIYFLGSDDYFWDSQVLSNFTQQLAETKDFNALLAYGRVNIILPTGEILQVANQPWKQIKKRFSQGCFICHQGVFHHKIFFEKYGKFDESFLIAGDYELLLRELKNKEPIFIPDVIVAAMQLGGVSSSPQYKLSALKEYAKARYKNGVLVLFPFEWLWSYFKAILWSVLLSLVGRKHTNSIVDFYRKLTGRNSVWMKM